MPTPFIERCLPISSLSVDRSQSVVLDYSVTPEDGRFHVIGLESRQYQLDASLRSVEQDAIGYRFDLLSEFGQTDAIENISTDAVNGTELITNDTFEVAVGSYWLRARNRFDDTRTVEFTVSAP